MSGILKQVYDCLNNRRSNQNAPFSDSLRRKLKDFLIKDGALYFCEGWLFKTEDERKTAKIRDIVWTVEERIQIVMDFHTSNKKHVKYENLMQKLSEDFYWPEMHNDVLRILKLCGTCESGTTQTAESSLNNSDIIDDTDDESAFSEQAREFWEEVELEILGPYQAGPDSEQNYFVAVFVDVFSVWTEMFVMENQELISIVLAIFTLISRRGVMNTIIHKGSESESRQLEKVLNLFVNEDCPVQVQHRKSSSLERHWERLNSRLVYFVREFPHCWFQYIEFFLLPFRASRAEHKDNTASYLSSSREMRLPASVSHQESEQRELHLTDFQIVESLRAFQDLFYNSLSKCDKAQKEVVVKERQVKSVSRKRKSENNKLILRKKLKIITKEEVGSYMYDYTNFSEVVLGYLQGKGLPPHLTARAKEAIVTASDSCELQNGKLYYQKAPGDWVQVLVDEEEQFEALVEAHINIGGKHYSISETRSNILSNYFWYSIRVDIEAFVKACPRCGNFVANIPEEGSDDDASATLTKSDTTLKNPTHFEDSTFEFEQIMHFHKKKKYSKYDRSLKVAQLSALFCLDEDGSLFCDNADVKKRRKVILTPKEKKSCLEECHVTSTGKHRSKDFTQSNIVKKYYWPQMGREIDKYVGRCLICKGHNGRKKSQGHTSITEQEEDGLMDTAGDVQSAMPGFSTMNDAQWTTPMEASEIMPVNILEDSPKDNKEGTRNLNWECVQENDEVAVRDNPGSNHKAQVRNNQKDVTYDKLEETRQESDRKRVGESHMPNKKEDRIEKYKEIFTQKNLIFMNDSDHNYSAQLTDDEYGSRKNIESHGLKEGKRHMSGVQRTTQAAKRGTGLKMFSCMTCQLTFASKESAELHQSKHFSPFGKDVFLCDGCGRLFSTLNKLTAHQETTHTDCKEFCCQHCSVVFLNKASLSYHEKKCEVTPVQLFKSGPKFAVKMPGNLDPKPSDNLPGKFRHQFVLKHLGNLDSKPSDKIPGKTSPKMPGKLPENSDPKSSVPLRMKIGPGSAIKLNAHGVWNLDPS